MSIRTSERDDAPFDLLLRRLNGYFPLSEADVALVRSLCRPARSAPAGVELGGDSRRLFLVAGWACRWRVLPNGRRQILGFILPGDSVGLTDGPEPPLHHSVAVTRVSVIDATALVDRINSGGAGEALSRAFAAADRCEAARHLDHVVRLGAMSAIEGMDHLLGELHRRFADVGLAEEGRFPLAVSQDTLGEALGLSGVHTNRVLAQLRREGRLELGPGWAQLSDARLAS